MNLFEGLTHKKKKIIKYNKSPILIVAGAGTGKTTVLTHKVAYLIEKGVDPSKIFMSTFTVKASEEMRTKIQSLTRGKDISNMYVVP